MQSIFVEHLNRTFFLKHGRGKIFYLDFILAKFNARVILAAMGVRLQNRMCDIYGECKSYDFSKHGPDKQFYSDLISEKFRCFKERVSFSNVGLEH